MEINPIDLRQIDEKSANIYEAIIVASKRARQLNDESKIEFNAMVNTIPAAGGDDESEDIDNPAQLKVSLEFEAREKQHLKALNELLEGSIDYEYKQ